MSDHIGNKEIFEADWCPLLGDLFRNRSVIRFFKLDSYTVR